MIQNSFLTKYLALSIVVVSLLSVAGCNVFDREETIPAYLFIDEFTLETKNDNSQGSAAHDIRDAWVYVDGNLVGVFEVPVTVPILTIDTARVTVLGGIINNGLVDNRKIYPFYKAIQDTIILTSNKIDSIFPSVTYHDSTQFKWIEDFEDRTISMEPSGVNTTEDSIRLTMDPNEVLDYSNRNQVSGYVEFDSVGQVFESSTISRFTIPSNSSAYLEMNYNLESGTQVGFYVFNEAGIQIDRVNVLYLFPTDGEWKKSYVSFNEDMSNPDYANATFKVFLYSSNSSDNPNARNYFDNLKLLHY